VRWVSKKLLSAKRNYKEKEKEKETREESEWVVS